MATTFEVERKPLIVAFDEQPSFNETYGFGGSGGKVYVEGQFLLPKGKASDTLIFMMHPASVLHLMPLPSALAASGQHVLCMASRYMKNDTPLIMEKVAADIGASMRHCREKLGYKKIVYIGWSGGGSLSLFYQCEAEAPSITHTPAGDAYDLTKAGLVPADGVIFIAAHISRGHLLTEWIDPSVTDEANPEERIVELDLYDPRNPNQPPYGADYVTRFRAAQKERAERITTWVLETLERLRKKGGKEMERGFIVHRTMADPRWLDPSLEPNGRKPGMTYMGHPETVNTGPVGLARFSTLRSWLSQWSLSHSNANALKNGPRLKAPVLVVENGADDAVPTSHPKAVFEALGSYDKEYVLIEGAGHYYRDQPELCQKAVAIVTDWMARHGWGG